MNYLLMRKTTLLGFVFLSQVMFSNTFAQSSGSNGSMLNKLSTAEIKKGWKLLFDGSTLTGWKTYNRTDMATSWSVKDGAIFLDAKKGRSEIAKGDLVTLEDYDDFELSLEWKISECGNSGIMYRIVEDPKYKQPYLTGPEMQVLDNKCHPDAKIITHRSGDFYDVMASKTENVKPAGEWNAVRIIMKGYKLEQWQNGVKQIKLTLGSDEINAIVEKSKWKNQKDWGKALIGKIGLQDHGDPVWFRNIKIRSL
ncbi:MAG: DUF1080 domain-containing protein [Bacteroidetes bacterium]|jgi:hypothetical protein|nr:DUF1080 domain-containing protein [Bacteroidota bacterium]